MLDKLNTAFTRVTDHPDFGKLLLRLTFGILILFHGVAKMENGVGWIAKMLQAAGLPGFIAYGAYIGEVIAPVLIILGIFTRPAALVMDMVATGVITPTQRVDTPEQLMAALRRGEISIGVVIPHDFERRRFDGREDSASKP